MSNIIKCQNYFKVMPFYSAWALAMARTNSWGNTAKLTPHGDNFNEKRTVAKSRSALIAGMKLGSAGYKWASLK